MLKRLCYLLVLWPVTVMAETELDKEAVLQANDAFYAAFRSSDMEAMRAIWGMQEPIAVQHPSSPHIQGRAAVLESWRQILRAPPNISCTVEDMLEDDARWAVICIEHIGPINIRMVNLFHRENGDWKMIYHGPAPRPRLSS